MTKRQLIDQIITVNRSAPADFLARFDDKDLRDYLDHLSILEQPRLTGDANRYAKYFTPADPDRHPRLDEPQDDGPDTQSHNPLWFASDDDPATDDLSEEPARCDAGFAYDTDYAPQTVLDTTEEPPGEMASNEPTCDETIYDDSPSVTDTLDEQDDDDLVEEDIEEPLPEQEPVEEPEGEPVAVGQYASPLTRDSDKDFESWLF